MDRMDRMDGLDRGLGGTAKAMNLIRPIASLDTVTLGQANERMVARGGTNMCGCGNVRGRRN